MNEIISFNRKTLVSVKKWINIEDWNLPNSIFNYGLPRCILHLIDMPINTNTTEVDLICNYLLQLAKDNKKVNYLEIGVSVGKTFYQIIKFSETFLDKEIERTFSCIDIEKINPILDNLLTEIHNNKTIVELEKDKNLINSIRTAPVNIISTWNNITYYEGDEFDQNIWSNMKSNYNFIFSDALHEPNALLKEYENIKNNTLLDPRGFIYCFDDLESEKNQPMWRAVFFIYNDIIASYPELNVSIEHFVVNGWIGEHEHPHNFGVIKALPRNA